MLALLPGDFVAVSIATPANGRDWSGLTSLARLCRRCTPQSKDRVSEQPLESHVEDAVSFLLDLRNAIIVRYIITMSDNTITSIAHAIMYFGSPAWARHKIDSTNALMTRKTPAKVSVLLIGGIIRDTAAGSLSMSRS